MAIRMRTSAPMTMIAQRLQVGNSIARVLVMLAGLACAVAAAGAPEALRDFNALVAPFVESHCSECHGEKKQKGVLRLDTLSRDFANASVAGHWMDVMDRLTSGDMPPKKQPRPKPEEITRVAELITAQLNEAEAARQAAEGEKVSYRRLSRDEFRNTIRDLLGITYDASDPSGLPEDPDWQGFERFGSVLTVSPAQIEKYLAAAEANLDEALALGPRPTPQVIRWTPFMLRSGYRWPSME